MAVIRINAVLDQAHLPFQPRGHQRALDQLTIDPFKALLAVRIAQQRQILTTGRCGGATGAQRRVAVCGAMAVLATDLHRMADFAIQMAIAMAVLTEVTIDTMHADVDMD